MEEENMYKMYQNRRKILKKKERNGNWKMTSQREKDSKYEQRTWKYRFFFISCKFTIYSTN
jgi:hypothetical protein